MTLTHDCNSVNPDGRVPVVRGSSHDRAQVTPIATPLADALAASYGDGGSDAAGCDAAVMTYEEWLEEARGWIFDPEPSYWEVA